MGSVLLWSNLEKRSGMGTGGGCGGIVCSSGLYDLMGAREVVVGFVSSCGNGGD